YPSYNGYLEYLSNFFHKSYINIFIYGNVIIPNETNRANKVYSDLNQNDDMYKYMDLLSNKTYSTNNMLYGKRQEQVTELQGGKYGKGILQPNSEPLQQNFIENFDNESKGIEYIVNLCESFIYNITNSLIKKSDSTYKTKKLINNENVEISVKNLTKNISNNSIVVSYIIESDSMLSDTLIKIIADLISPYFIELVKIKHNEGYMVDVKTFFTRSGLGGLLFFIQSSDKDVEQLEVDICSYVRYLTYQLMNIAQPDLVKNIKVMKEQYIMNNSISTFNQEYLSIFEQLITKNECFDEKEKVVKIYDELIKCPKIILNKINYILKNSKKTIFKEYKTVSVPNNKNESTDDINSSRKCNYSYNNDVSNVLSNIQLTNIKGSVKTKHLNEKHLRNKILKMNDSSYENKSSINNLSNFVEIKKGFFQYILDYFKYNNNSNLKYNYLDFKSCDADMYKDDFNVFQNFTNDINIIRDYFLSKFSNDEEIKEKCSIDYEEIKTCDKYNID
ncbi:petidase, M16 family, partial [Hepatocystis sp. ex Piliocolobus tephrosceles]